MDINLEADAANENAEIDPMPQDPNLPLQDNAEPVAPPQIDDEDQDGVPALNQDDPIENAMPAQIFEDMEDEEIVMEPGQEQIHPVAQIDRNEEGGGRMGRRHGIRGRLNVDDVARLQAIYDQAVHDQENPAPDDGN